MFSKYTLAMVALVVVLHIATTAAQKSIDPDPAVAPSDTAAAAPGDKKSRQKVVRGGPGQGRRGVRRRVRMKNGKRVRRVKAANGKAVVKVKPATGVKETGLLRISPIVITKPDVSTDPPIRTQKLVSKAPSDSNLNLAASNLLKSNKEAAKVKVAKRKEKQVDAGPQDEFFGLFDTATTTVGPNSGVPPPDFDPNRPPGEKVMPEVDTLNSRAYDGTRESLCQLILYFAGHYIVHNYCECHGSAKPQTVMFTKL